MHSSPSLRARLSLLIATLVLLLSWLFSALITAELSSRLRETAGQQLAELAHQMGDRLDRDMASRSLILQVFGELEVLANGGSRQQQMRLLDQLRENMPALAWIGLLDAQGNVQVGSDRILEGTNIAARPVYVQGSQGLFIGDVHEAVLLASLLPNPSGEPMKFVDISFPILAPDGALQAVLAAHLSWAWAGEVSRSLLDPVQERRRMEFFVLSSDGTVLLGPEGWVGRSLAHLLAEEAFSQGDGWNVLPWGGERQDDYLTGVASADGHGDYPGLGWTIVARQPLHLADLPARQLRQHIFLAGSVLAVLFALGGWVLVSYLTRPLRAIAEAADRLSAGEDAEIPVVRGSGELARLSTSIRHLVVTLGHQEDRLEVMSELAMTDTLTGLANRAAFGQYLREHDRSQPLALLYMDLDGFKQVNDELGHAAGDQLLSVVAARLRSKIREGDLLVRLGGDEFVMALNMKPAEMQELARLIAERTLKALAMPITLEGQPVHVGCSMGGAFWPDDGVTLEAVLAQADKALYRAKSQGKHRVVFTSDVTE
ncbi:MAG: diguanylate cyclase domain-containing protein [Pseudomonas sp.]